MKVLYYDFPSEYRSEISNAKKIRSLRVMFLLKLYTLGLSVANSTIIIPDENLKLLEELKKEIEQKYEGFEKPTLKLLDANKQEKQLKQLAIAKLRLKAEKTLETLKEKKSIKNLYRFKRIWLKNMENAKKLHIQIPELKNVIDAINQAIKETQK
ncbi:MAG: hypothetical protein QXT31_03450 [Candidatus Bathyarchaeia archaeon]